MLFLRLLKESAAFALHALISNKLRTLLSLLGISIGIFAIISVFTVVDSLEGKIRNSVASLGSNVIYIDKWPWLFEEDYPWWKYINRPVPGYKEMLEVQERSNYAEAVVFTVSSRRRTLKFKNNSVENVVVEGGSHDYDKIRTLDVADGRYFSLSESQMGHPVCLIGNDIANALNPNGSIVDKEITVSGRKVKVIGILKKEGTSFIGNSLDNIAIVPINYVRTIIDIRSMRLNPSIRVKGKPGIPNSELMEELRGIMRSVRRIRPKGDDTFALNEPSLISSKLDSLFAVLSTAGWIIGGFSILVGGFGIANIMFVSVKERTNIIGIQKSLGAKNFFILSQFLIEAVILALIGGAIGLIIIFLITLLCTYVLDFELVLSLANINLGLGVSAIIGLISGFMPAYAASQMDPVDAIRSN